MFALGVFYDSSWGFFKCFALSCIRKKNLGILLYFWGIIHRFFNYLPSAFLVFLVLCLVMDSSWFSLNHEVEILTMNCVAYANCCFSVFLFCNVIHKCCSSWELLVKQGAETQESVLARPFQRSRTDGVSVFLMLWLYWDLFNLFCILKLLSCMFWQEAGAHRKTPSDCVWLLGSIGFWWSSQNAGRGSKLWSQLYDSLLQW